MTLTKAQEHVNLKKDRRLPSTFEQIQYLYVILKESFIIDCFAMPINFFILPLIESICKHNFAMDGFNKLYEVEKNGKKS